MFNVDCIWGCVDNKGHVTTSAVANPLPRLGSEIRNWSNRKTKIALDHLFLCSEFENLVKCTE